MFREFIRSTGACSIHYSAVHHSKDNLRTNHLCILGKCSDVNDCAARIMTPQKNVEKKEIHTVW